MLKISEKQEGAATVAALATDDREYLIFRVSKHELLNAAKPSKTGQSQGCMLRLSAEFNTEIEGTPARVQVSAGRGGAGTWLQLRPYAMAAAPAATE